jgi:hypothetical protein
MKATRKVRLTQESYHDWGCITTCKCGRKIIFNKEDFEPNENIHCKVCGHMVIAVCEDGAAYYVGNKVFPDHQNGHLMNNGAFPVVERLFYFAFTLPPAIAVIR